MLYMAGKRIKKGDQFEIQVHEFKVDTPNDLENLPTMTDEGKFDWCDTYTSPYGSNATVISTGEVYILNDEGWKKLGWNR